MVTLRTYRVTWLNSAGDATWITTVAEEDLNAFLRSILPAVGSVNITQGSVSTY